MQLHTAAQAIAHRLYKKLEDHDLFGPCFSYNNCYFSFMNGEPVTVERFVEGQFVKFVNNNGKPCLPEPGQKDLLAKAETLCHFSYVDSNQKLMLVDIQGAGYKLYDPEIATQEDEASSENFFCGGNLYNMAFENFFAVHKCNVYCDALDLPEVVFDSTEE